MANLYLLLMEPGASTSAGNTDPTFSGTKEDNTKLWSTGYRTKDPARYISREDLEVA